MLAAGMKVGKSLAEPGLVREAERITAVLRAKGGDVPLPTDVVCAGSCPRPQKAEIKPVGEVAADDLILDIGPKTAAAFARSLSDAGPSVERAARGVRVRPVWAGNRAIAQAIAGSRAFPSPRRRTLAAIAKYGVAERISYVSTEAALFLEFLEGKKLPAIEILEQRYAA